MLGDVILAEPNALIAFAGPRHRADDRQSLPPGFQTSEYLLATASSTASLQRKDLRSRDCELPRLLANSHS
jgi:acetyl-CoA carboxylase carboxyl transferase subunit beta